MADNSGELEGEPFGIIEFRVIHLNRRLKSFTLDVGLKSPLIGGHKQDLAEMFNFEGKTQTWIYKEDITLEDGQSLWDYGIHGTETTDITIILS